MYEMYIKRPARKHSEIVDSIGKLKRLAKKLAMIDEWAFDTETNTLKVYGPNDDFKCVGISISWGAYNNYYIPLGHIREEDWDRQLPVAKVRKWLKKPFERKDVRIIGQNLKFDMHVMARIGIDIKTNDLFDIMIASWLCDENSPNGLKENSTLKLEVQQEHFAEVTNTVTKEIKKQYGLKSNNKATFDMVLIDDGAPYALDDAFYTWCLYLGCMDELEEEGMFKVFNKTYVRFLRTLYEMEERGVVVDLERLEQMKKDVAADKGDLLYRIYELAGCEFNTNSNDQLQALLFGYQKPISDPRDTPKWRSYTEKEKEKKLKEYNKKLWEAENNVLMKYSFNFKPFSKTGTGAPQANAKTLMKLAKQTYKVKHKRDGVELCKLLLQYKKLEKLSSAFLEGLEVQLYSDGKAHPSFNIIGTDSGRISCSGPNLQQLPKAEEEDKYQIRSLFIGNECVVDENGDWVSDNVEEGYPLGCHVERKKIIAGDYNNLEMRVLAHFSLDKNLLEMFETGSDTHSSTAINMFELDCDVSEVKKKYPHLRQAAKVINFLLMYGGGAFTLYNNLKDDPWNPIDLGDKSYLDTYGVKKGEDVAQIYIDKYFDTYSGVTDFMRKQKRFAHKNGYVQTLLRRKRRLPDINGHDFKQKSYCERLSVNSCIQGSAADITMSAQNRINADPWFAEHGALMLLQIHDELVFECPEKYVDECIERARSYMGHPFGDNVELNLPLLTSWDSGESYQDAK